MHTHAHTQLIIAAHAWVARSYMRLCTATILHRRMIMTRFAYCNKIANHQLTSNIREVRVFFSVFTVADWEHRDTIVCRAIVDIWNGYIIMFYTNYKRGFGTNLDSSE